MVPALTVVNMNDKRMMAKHVVLINVLITKNC